MTSAPRVLFLNRSYWPEAEATGQLLAELLEDLSAEFTVAVVAGQPNQNPSREQYCLLGLQRRRGVRIHRVLSFRLPKLHLLGRAVNILSYTIAAFFTALLLDRPDIIVVETDPPVLSLLGDFLRHWHRCRFVVYLQDIYPDLAVGLGKLSDTWWVRWWRTLQTRINRSADRIVVLSRDMHGMLTDAGIPSSRIECIPNWVDVDAVYPVKKDNRFRSQLGLRDSFVVMYSGNLGLTQKLDSVLEAASLLENRTDVSVVLVGNGALKPALERRARALHLKNVRFLDFQPKERLAESLSAADVQLVPLNPAIARCLMPSKLYGILASGTAVLAMAPENSELAQIVRENRVGLVVAPENPHALAEAIRWCADNRTQVEAMGLLARDLAVRCFHRPLITQRFAELLARVASDSDGAASPVQRKSVGALGLCSKVAMPPGAHTHSRREQESAIQVAPVHSTIDSLAFTDRWPAGLRVCHLGKYYPPFPGGMETHVQTLARAQAAMGCEVQVFCVNHRAGPTVREVDNNVEVIRFRRFAMVSKLDVCPGLVRSLRKLKVDVVHVHVPNPSMIMAVLFALRRTPLVVTYQSDHVRQVVRSWAFRPIESSFYRRVQAILATSPRYSAGSALLQRFSDRVHVVPLGIELEPYLHAAAQDIAQGERIRSQYQRPIWLACGRLIYYKGLKNALHALTDTPGTLLIIGDGPEREGLEARAKKLGIANRVVFLGHVPSLVPYYRAADALWFPSNARSEAFGLVQVEAMACGCPVLNTNIPASGVPWVSQHGLTGLTVPVNDARALAEAANRLLTEPGFRKRLSENAQKRAVEEFDHRVMATRVLSIYQKVLSRNGHQQGSSPPPPLRPEAEGYRFQPFREECGLGATSS